MSKAAVAKLGLYLETPTPGWALIAFRVLFGFLMAVDTIIERGWAENRVYEQLKDVSTGKMCAFPVVDWLPRLTPDVYAVACSVQAFAAICISLGLLFRFSCLIFLATFWSLLLLDKLHWNNHSYLYAILTLMLVTTRAGQKFSLDSLLLRKVNRQLQSTAGVFMVPYWNYAVLQLQIAIVYTYAGLNKINPDWLAGRALPSLSQHWVFQSARHFMLFDMVEDPAIFDFFAIRLAGILIDSLAGVALFFAATRPAALLFTTAFHLMNSQMFSIGVFAGVMLASQAIFLPNYTLPPAWKKSTPIPIGKDKKKPPVVVNPEPTRSHYLLLILGGCHFLGQLLIPQSHVLMPGLMTWSKTGQYGFSWEMMLHEWNIAHITVTLRDKTTGEDLFLDADKLVPYGNQRWAFHPDMIWQFSRCVHDMIEHVEKSDFKTREDLIAKRYSLYIDSWISLNQRVHQRLVDPQKDFFSSSWSVFEKPDWLLPLLEELPHLNAYNATFLMEKLKITDELLVEDKSHVEYLIFADFPGNSLHHFIDGQLDDVQLFVLNGSVTVQFDSEKDADYEGPIVALSAQDDPLSIPNGQFHTLTTTSDRPSLCLYTFVNTTMWQEVERELKRLEQEGKTTAKSNLDSASALQQMAKSATNRVFELAQKAKRGVELSEQALEKLVLGRGKGLGL